MLPLLHLGAVDSTQSFLSRHPELGFCGVMADTQIAGRGRGKNSWDSRPGTGLYISACLPPSGVSAGTILQSAMTAAAEVLEPCGVCLGLKWPNDLVAYKQHGSEESLVKIGGIIGEQKNDRVILGMGLNIFYAPELPERAIPPASLASLGAVDIPEMIDMAKMVLSAWQNLDSRRTPAFRWPERGDAIRWEDGRGTCQGWEPDGRLAVMTESGLVLLTSGDVSGLVSQDSDV